MPLSSDAHANTHTHTHAAASSSSVSRARTMNTQRRDDFKQRRQKPPQSSTVNPAVTGTELEPTHYDSDTENRIDNQWTNLQFTRSTTTAATTSRVPPIPSSNSTDRQVLKSLDAQTDELRQLKAENTLLGSIIQQLQLDRQNKSHLFRESSESLAAITSQYEQLQQSQAQTEKQNAELKGALLEAHKQLEEIQTSQRLVKLSSNRQIAEVVQSWKNEVAELTKKHDAELTASRRATSLAAAKQKHFAPSRTEFHQATNAHQPPSVAADATAAEKLDDEIDIDCSDESYRSLVDRCAYLEIMVEKLQEENLSLTQSQQSSQAAATVASKEYQQLLTRNGELHAELHESQTRTYALQSENNSLRIKLRMENSKSILDKIRHNNNGVGASSNIDSHQATSNPFGSNSSGSSSTRFNPFTSSSSATAPLAMSSSISISQTPSSVDQERENFGLSLTLLQSELKAERQSNSELRTLYDISHDSESKLRNELMEQIRQRLSQQEQVLTLNQSINNAMNKELPLKQQLVEANRQSNRVARENAALKKLFHHMSQSSESNQPSFRLPFHHANHHTNEAQQSQPTATTNPNREYDSGALPSSTRKSQMKGIDMLSFRS